MKNVVRAAMMMVLLGSLPAALYADCSCALAKKTNGWCKECKVGYVASIKIPSPLLFEVLDAHGHAIDPNLLRCDPCRKAVETDGFCERSRMGFVKKQAYFSRLAYYAARGNVRDRSTIVCATCRKNSEDYGWCKSCRVGMVGNFVLKNRADLDKAQRAVKILRRAVGTLDRCETCAVATFTGGRCPLCKIAYKDGKPVAAKAKRVSTKRPPLVLHDPLNVRRK